MALAVTIFAKNSILDIWQSSEDAFALCQGLLYVGLRHKKLNFPLWMSSVSATKPQILADLVTFTEKMENYIFCAVVDYKDPGLSLVSQPQNNPPAS